MNDKDKKKEFDAVVVGSGPAGALTAAYLCKAGLQVALLEEGDVFAPRSMAAFSIDEMAAKYRAGGLTMILGRPRISYVEGRCLGGGSEVNAGIFQRCPDKILAGWSESHGFQDIHDGLITHFEKVEEEFFQMNSEPITGLANRLNAGAETLGLKAETVPQLNFQREGTNAFRLKGMSQTYIPTAVENGCRIFTGHKALKIIKKKNLWNVRCSSKVEISGKSLFLCCGAIQTPALLLRSGIKHNVGRTLALHPSVKAVARFPKSVQVNEFFPGPVQIKDKNSELTFGCSVSSLPILAASLLDHPQEVSKLYENQKNYGIYYAMIRGANTGSISILPGFTEPVVSYQAAEKTLATLKNAREKLQQLLLAAGAEQVFLPKNDTAPLATYHLFGSVPGGENLALTAANSYGKMHGLEGLFVNDASLFCTSIGVNPQATIMALARRNVLHYLSEINIIH